MSVDIAPVYEFLLRLKQHNNRRWFKDHKTEYLQAKKLTEEFIARLLQVLGQTRPDLRYVHPAQTLYRIYRDIRFSVDKRPYKEAFCAFIAPGGRKSPVAGYYLHLEPGNTFAGGGIWRPPSEALRRIRTGIVERPEEFAAIVEAPDFQNYFGGFTGEKLKTIPRGFATDFPHPEWLRPKSYAVMHPLPDMPSVKQVAEIFAKIDPLNEFINRALQE